MKKRIFNAIIDLVIISGLVITLCAFDGQFEDKLACYATTSANTKIAYFIGFSSVLLAALSKIFLKNIFSQKLRNEI